MALAPASCPIRFLVEPEFNPYPPWDSMIPIARVGAPALVAAPPVIELASLTMSLGFLFPAENMPICSATRRWPTADMVFGIMPIPSEPAAIIPVAMPPRRLPLVPV